MRIGIVSDVHCDHEALATVAREFVEDGCEEIVLAGDAHNQYRFSNEVVDLIREYDMRYILGNHEEILLRPDSRAIAAAHLRAENVEFVRNAPWRIRTVIDGKVLTIVHANPFEPNFDYLYPGNPAFARCDELDTDYLVLGHTHRPMAERFGRTLVVNPGSLPLTRVEGVDRVLSYAVLDTTSGEASLVSRPRTPLPAGGGCIEP